jgi:hypothetical protein
MVARTFIVARGRQNELAERIINADPATAILFMAYYQGVIEADALFEAHLTKAAVDAANTIATFTNYNSDASRALSGVVRTITGTEQWFTSNDIVVPLAGGIVNNVLARAVLYYDIGTGAGVAGYADVSIGGAPLGTVVPGVATQNWEVDVTIDGGGLQQLAIAVNIADDYDTIAATLSTAITGGTCAFVGGAFRVTSATTGVLSTVIVAAGTLGVTSDLFAAITAAAAGNPVILYLAPVDGATDTALAVPMSHYEFAVPTTGVNLVFEAGASGLYRTG